ncbi:MAG: hypothetical protein WA621_08770 [Candidatus Acidiferrum sp.]
MRKSIPEHDTASNLRPGELVEVRSEAEILATLDVNGRLDAQPFMPEMLAFCGKQFRVYKRSDKTCDTISNTGSRRMWNTVHLEELRCDGSGHEGCQARCLLYWKEAWLKRVELNGKKSAREAEPASTRGSFTREDLVRATRTTGQGENAGKVIYSCQATEVLRASTPLPWWDIRQYYRDICWGNGSLSDVARAMFLWTFKKALRIGGYRLLLWTYDRIQKMRGGVPYPFLRGELKKTPTEDLNLQPGELVQIRSYEEILATLDGRNKNRGLYFDSEMVPFCGGKYRVIDRVERIVNEKTGVMSTLPGACIMMEGVICRSWYSDRRIACPRSIYSYWREIWVRRVE